MNEELGGVKPEASLDVLNSGACVMYVISVIFSVTILIVKATWFRSRRCTPDGRQRPNAG